MQMLATWLVIYKDILSGGGYILLYIPFRGCFQGVHLSQVHQQSCQVPNKTVKCTNFLSVVNIPAWMVHLRQVHPLKVTLARLVHFLLWQAAKPSGDKCTPLSYFTIFLPPTT